MACHSSSISLGGVVKPSMPSMLSSCAGRGRAVANEIVIVILYKDTRHKQNQKTQRKKEKKDLFLEGGYKNTGCSQPVQFSRVPRCPTHVRDAAGQA